MQQEQVMTRARLVLPGEVVTGTVVLRGGCIVEMDRTLSRLPSAIDLDGDFLLPGLVELHTDNLERHAMPRPKVRFPMWGAVQAHDAEVACAGITTVFDAVGVGDPYGQGFRAQNQGELLSVLDALEAAGVLRADHRIHARCELPAANTRALFEPFAHHPRLGLISLMDHTPGQRQWSDLDHARTYYTGKKGWTNAQFDHEVQLAPARQRDHAGPNRDWFAAYARATGLALASHDDTTAAHVDEAHHLGAVISEFPTTLAAARRARAHGLLTLAGAPNVLRGTSHAGNVAAVTLVREGVLDALSSDYVPASLLAAAWQLSREGLLDLPAAVRLVTLQPARAAGLADRGALAPGLRADLVRVREVAGHPAVRAVWNTGRRVV
ncbi:MAG: phosphonate metabolism protein PhnM [Pseudomonadota bacterium]|jgi:alpha-D-ribose 1-methylphosphonate 5-triphosphate diphosphatase